MRRILGTLLTAALSIATPAWAADGVREINQACALAGCWPGDSAGFPVVVTEPGSYRLTGSLSVASVATTAIRFNSAAAGSSIDLAGFSISGPVTCTGEPAACSGSGAGDGISGTTNLTVRNGTIRGMGGVGVQIGAGGVVEDLLVEQNGSYGIQISSSGGSRRFRVTGCRIRRNGDDGISAAWQDGAGSYAGNLVIGNVVTGNAGYGIRTQGALVRENVALRNAESGLGIFAGGTSGYVDNLLRGNNVGAEQVSGGTALGSNVCGDDTVCP